MEGEGNALLVSISRRRLYLTPREPGKLDKGFLLKLKSRRCLQMLTLGSNQGLEVKDVNAKPIPPQNFEARGENARLKEVVPRESRKASSTSPSSASKAEERETELRSKTGIGQSFKQPDLQPEKQPPVKGRVDSKTQNMKSFSRVASRVYKPHAEEER
ncbi:hypothetical protein VNO77_46336 [Canavalia gladiata]|uniref:Uncharacterized protein n=1 Tax=Canavalia gladiata TaxID=3824 RepID=A0AAN9JBK9_CANGL